MTDATWAPDLVIYHDKCADGIVAAWACWKRWTHEVHYLAANYGFQPPADVADKNILIVDFSYPQAQLEAMVEAGARSIVILDHHKTAQHDLAAFTLEENWPREITSRNVHVALEQLEMACCPPIVGLFDMDRSGAHMAWSFAFPSEPAPHVVVLAEQYDLWRFEPGTGDPAELLHLAFQAAGLTIREVDEIHWHMERGDMEPLNEGRAIYAWRAQLIEEIASRAHLRTVAGVEGVISVECPYWLVSAVGHYLLDKFPTAPFAAMSVTGESAVTWSLRSRDDRTDVSAVAKGQGGGGHRNAAGFRVEKRGRVTVTDWVGMARLTGEHHIRFPTNWRLEAFLTAAPEFIDHAGPSEQDKLVADLVQALVACRDQFDFYAREHRNAEKHEKAGTNERFAFFANRAIERARQIGGE